MNHTRKRQAPLMPIFFVFGLTIAAYVALVDQVKRDPTLAREGNVVVTVRGERTPDTLAASPVVAVATTTSEIAPPPVQPSIVGAVNATPKELRTHTYIEITDSCGPHFEGDCVNARTSPSTTSPSAFKLRTGVVLRTDGIVEVNGKRWHKVIFDEWIRYPERTKKVLYVAESYGVETKLEPPAVLDASTTPSKKSILVDRSEQKLFAYNEDGSLFMEENISTGKDSTPTPRGTFTIFRKTPSRYMQGPLPGISTDYYDLPGVPWNMYFTAEGGALHGAYWHDKFGRQWSHGCVNLPLDSAKELYLWADLGTTVTIRD